MTQACAAGKAALHIGNDNVVHPAEGTVSLLVSHQPHGAAQATAGLALEEPACLNDSAAPAYKQCSHICCVGADQYDSP